MPQMEPKSQDWAPVQDPKMDTEPPDWGEGDWQKFCFLGLDIHEWNEHQQHKLTQGAVLGSQSCRYRKPHRGNGDICSPRRAVSSSSMCCFSLGSQVFWSIWRSMSLAGGLNHHTLFGSHCGEVHLILSKGDVFYVGFSVVFCPVVPHSSWNNQKMDHWELAGFCKEKKTFRNNTPSRYINKEVDSSRIISPFLPHPLQ